MADAHALKAEACAKVANVLAAELALEYGLCDASAIAFGVSAILMSEHAGHHGDEPEVDIAKRTSMLKKVTLELLGNRSGS